MTFKIVVAERVTDEILAAFTSKLSDDWRVEVCNEAFSSAAMQTALADAQVLVSMFWPPDAPRDAPIKLLHMNGAGYDGIKFDHLPSDCAVCNVYEHEIGIAEYVVAAMLEWEIGLSRHAAALREGRWTDGFAKSCPLHGELFGKTVGFVGYGRIARETAKRLQAFGLRTMARTRSVSACDQWIDDGGPMEDLAAMLRVADYVVMTPPLTAATLNLADADFFAAMRSDAVIINVARGPVVNEQALYRALHERRIGGAIIDTWYRYPKPDEDTAWPSALAFHELDNIIMTPHSSGWSAGLMERRWGVIVDNLERWRRGEPLVNVLKPVNGAPVVDL
jgi:phosphoglycerate dehydrogenase-like enzyme